MTKTVNVEMPDGTIVTDVPEGTTRDQLMEKLKARGQEPALGQPTAPEDKFAASPAGKLTAGVEGVLDVARAGVTSTGANVVGGLMGAATLATNAMGLTNDDPVAMIRSWQEKAYPVTTEAGKAIAGTVAGLSETFIPSKKLGESQFQKSGSPLEATVAELLPDAMATIVGARAPAFVKEAAMRGAGELAKKAVFNKTKDEAYKSARRAAFKVSPTEAGGIISRTIAGIGNKAEVERMISVSNEQRVVELAKDDMEIPESVPLDRASYGAAKLQAAKPYQEARGLGVMQLDAPYVADVLNAGVKFEQVAQDFSETELGELSSQVEALRGKYIRLQWDAGSAVDQMSFLRERSADLLRSDSAVDRKMGFVYRDLAAAFEDRLWRHAKEAGKPEVAARFQQARKQLAKIHVYEDATNLDTGRISARSIVAQREAKGGSVDPFTDNLQLIANSAGAFPKSFQQMDKKGRFGPISVFEWMALIGGATTAGAGSRLIGGGIVAGALSREAARVGVASRAGQALSRPPSNQPGPIRRAAMGIGGGTETAGAVAGAEAGNE